MLAISPEIYVGLPANSKHQVLNPFTSLSLEGITAAVSPLYNLTKDQIFARTRKRNIVIPRMIIIYLTLKTGKYTLKGLGKLIGMDHSTIIYSRDTVIDLMSIDKKFTAEVERAEKAVYF